MKLPDPRTLVEAPRKALSRFPATALASVVFMGLLLLQNHLRGGDESDLPRWVLAAAWAISAFFLVEIASGGRWALEWVLLRLTPIPVIGLWFLLSDRVDSPTHLWRYGLWVSATHLAIALVRSRQESQFWQWNRLLLERAIQAWLFALFLAAGGAGALWILQYLLQVPLPHRIWGDLWLVVSSVFLTFQFLSGVPDHGEEVEPAYPTAMRVFSTRVLLPLAVVYLALLYAYGAKILLSWTLPEGKVAIPIAAFAGFGILAHLLLTPLGAADGPRWVGMWTRWFHTLLLPLCTLLWVSVGKRIHDYGVTEERYFGVVLALWLPLQSIWFLSGKRSLRFVPASLLVLALVVGWGPWGAFEVSRRSQLSRLDALLDSTTGAGTGSEASKQLSWESATRINGLVEYLLDQHDGRGLEARVPALETWREDSLLGAVRSARYGDHPLMDSILAALGVPRVRPGDRSSPAGEWMVNLNARNLRAEIPLRTHLVFFDTTLSDSEALDLERPVGLLMEGQIRTFRCDTLGVLFKPSETWVELPSSPVLQDTSGEFAIVVQSAGLLVDAHRKRLRSLSGMVLFGRAWAE
ncbi:MAG: DUF4153 domain-containing protein [Fibrobacteria bacterium]|nr:DUF4153 domain-containing protein [Fibrobacteria bacterium]